MTKNNNTFRWVLRVATLALLTVSVHASAQVTVSGKVTDADTSDPIENAEVHIFANGLGDFVGTTDAAGDYSIEITNLTMSTELTIEAAGPLHAPQRYGGTVENDCYFTCGGGTGQMPVEPSDGPITGIDFTLEQGATVSGDVLARIDASAIPGIQVIAYSDSGFSYSPDFFSPSDANGAYTSRLALPPGDYFMLALPQSENYVAQAWQDTSCEWSRCPITETDPVSLQVGSPTTGIDFALDPGAVVSGTIEPASANRLVSIWNAAGIYLTGKVFIGTPGDSEWRFDKLAGGSYYIDYGPIGVTDYIRRIHNGALCGYSACDRATGEALSVPEASVVEDLDFVMDTGGNITGTVVEAASAETPPFTPNGNIAGEFRVLTPLGEPVGGGFIQDDGEGNLTFATSRALPPGQYLVRTYMDFSDKGIGYNHPAYASGYIPGFTDMMYGSGACAGMDCDEAGATLVDVVEGEATDIVLGLVEGSSISGTITDDKGQPLDLTTVKLVNANNELIAATSTESDGTYAFGAFPAGQYYVRTSVAGDTGNATFLATDPKAYFDRIHGSQTSCSEQLCNPANGTVIDLDGTSDAANVDIVVEPGPIIRGQIIDVSTGLAIPRGRVAVYTDDGTLVGRYKISSQSAQYQTTALAPGTYVLQPQVSPAFETVDDQALLDVSGAALVQTPLRASARAQDSIAVTIGTEDVNASIAVVDSVLNQIFRSRFSNY